MTESAQSTRPPANKVRRLLAAGSAVFGASVTLPAPDVVELCAAVGFDFVTIDTEHEAFTDEQVAHVIRAAESYDITPILRIGSAGERKLRFLNAGAQGLHLPRCESAADARAFVADCRFAPAGVRTFYALGRAANYGVGIDDAGWAAQANDELLLVASVESIEASGRIGELGSVDGLDALHIGARDLWQSMGMPPEAGALDAAVANITQGIVAAGKIASVQPRLTDDVYAAVRRHIDAGARMVTVSALDFLRFHGPPLLRALRSIAAS